MTIENLRSMSAQTNKALVYLIKKDCKIVCDWINVEIYGEKKLVIKIFAADCTEKIREHIKKQYPLANVEYTSSTDVDAEKERREKARIEYLNK